MKNFRPLHSFFAKEWGYFHQASPALPFLFGIDDAGAAFVICQHGTNKGKSVGDRRWVGQTDTNTVFEQTIALTCPMQTKQFRRVTIELNQATRDGGAMALFSRYGAQATDTYHDSE